VPALPVRRSIAAENPRLKRNVAAMRAHPFRRIESELNNRALEWNMDMAIGKSWRSIALLAAVSAPFLEGAMSPAAAQQTRISGPVQHDNLAIYFVHGPSAPGPVPLTLKEAMEAGKVVVHETGNVSSLAIENAGEEEVFIQAGDIVKGGQQDRVLTVSFLVPAKSGRMPIAAYCVEQGRWSARGQEDVKRFASADKSLHSREAKLALLAPSKPTPVPATATSPTDAARTQQIPHHPPNRTTSSNANQAGQGASRQSEVWQSVSETQRKLSANVGASVAAPTSASSLQLTLENAALGKARAGYVTVLRSKATAPDIVGYVVVIGGRIEGGDVYASNALFQKMWSKQLDAAATAAIAEKDAKPSPVPEADAIRAFLAGAEAGTATVDDIAGTALMRETRDTEKAVLAETRRKAGSLVHRAYLAR
jgi:hypothetical protein